MKNLLVALTCFVTACVATTPAVRPDEPIPQNTATPQSPDQGTDDELEATKRRYAELQGELTKRQGAFNETTAMNAELQKQADASAQHIDEVEQQLAAVTSERDRLAQQVTDMQAKLVELTKEKTTAEATAAIFRDIVEKLRPMKELNIETRDGRMILTMSTDILFDSGRIAIKENGKAALAQIAQALKSVNNRKFYVAGHTDDVPIRNKQFPSNWELSTRRAVEVVHYLIKQEMNPRCLAAAGYGEFAPIAKNDSDRNRAKNRRIEIVLLPELLELPQIDDMTASQTAQ